MFKSVRVFLHYNVQLPVGCDHSPWIDKARPVRYYYGTWHTYKVHAIFPNLVIGVSGNDPNYLQCAWTAKHTAVRILVAAVGIAVAVLFFVGGIIKHRRWLTILVRIYARLAPLT